MISNYLKIALRYMSRHKLYSFINIAGLSVGLAVSMLIGLWIYNEWSYNRNFDNYDRIALVIRQFNYNSQRINLPGSPYAMRDELLSKYPGDLSSVVMSTPPGYHLMAYGDERYLRQGRYMDPEGAGLFSLRMLEGTRAGLGRPGAVLLSRSMANTIFGNADPIGKTIRLDGVSEATVTGVYENFPMNSYLKNTAFIASMRLFLEANPGEAGPAEQRRKEIGIRKVLGASEFSVWRLLSKEFLGLVIFGMVFAAPAAWYYMHGWLQQYEYRYTISWVIFVMAGGGALVVALLTVGYQAVRAARANPVESLRSD
jgi:ABC-type antimicrobial peptide transport system permease subunit